MRDTTRRQPMPAAGAAAVFFSGISMALFAILLVPALAAAQSGRGAPQKNPRLASLQIEIWPEYDRPAALVLLKGELAADAALPADVSLRIPASSGGPAAVAYATAASGNLLNLKYERKEAKDFVTVRFRIPERFFHVEFYDPLATNTPDRSYTYVWPGDLAVGRLSVIVQEPAGASGVSVQPSLDANAAGQDGLRYRSAELGALEAGKPLPIRIRYTKTDSRSSSELLKPVVKPNAANSIPQLRPAASEQEMPGWLIILAGAAAALAGAGAAWMWWRRRATASGAQPGGAGFCSKCGNRMAANDRFCSKCGAPV